MATKTQTRSDNSLRDDVLLELKWDPKISSASDVGGAVKDGVVTLTGFVPSFWEKDAAEKAAKRVYGVKGVANDIGVKLFWQRTDPEIARAAVRELESHVSIPADRLKVTVKLYGSVSSWAERDEAERAAGSAPGTTMVENHILVNP
jgi:osmotically-inducible protein OsmY